ncbi:MAG: queuosine salvage family protein [Syntrophobacter sp.]
MKANFPKPSALPVLASAHEVAARARWVFFHPERIDHAIGKWGHLLDSAPRWDHPCHFSDQTEETVRWIFSLDVLNHCFWPDPGDPVWTVRFNGQDWSGYWGLAASLKRALSMGIPVTNPAWLSRISENDLARIFSGEGTIPLFAERLMNLREAGAVIVSQLGGDLLSLFTRASGSAVRLVTDLVSLFASFRDEAVYLGGKVYFWKRAQIFASDVFMAFEGKMWGCFHDIGSLTAFADYKLPQVLRELGIISYHPELAARIDALKFIGPGSEKEVEIRAMTIIAVHAIRALFSQSGFNVTSAQVDGWLWALGQYDAFRARPYHRCRTIFY